MMKNFKKYLSVLLCAILVVSSLSAIGLITAIAEGTNLITNGTLDDGLNGWTPMWAGTNSLTTEGGFAINGNTLCMNGYSGSWQSITVEKNTDYVVTANMRTTAANTTHMRVYAGTNIDPNQVNNIAPIAQYTVPTDTWGNSIANASVEFNSGDNTTVTVYFVNNTGNVAWADNIVAEKVLVGEIKNGNFEDGANGWTNQYSNGNTVFDSSNGYTISGNAFCIASWDGVRQVINVEKNKTYSISADFRTTGANKVHMKIMAGAMTDPNAINGATGIAQGVVAAETWNNSVAKLSLTFNSGENTQVTLWFLNRNGNIAVVDNVVMEEVLIGEIKNGTFDDGANGWTNQYSNGNTVFDSSAGYTISGNAFCIASWDGVRQVINVEKNKTYSISADFRTTGANKVHMKIMAGAMTDPNAINGATGIAQGVVAAETWNNSVAKLTLTFNSGDNTQVTLWFLNRNGNIAVVDNVVMEEIVVSEFANGDFEGNTYEPWISSGGTIVDSANPYKISGNYSLNLTQGGMITQTVKVEANSRYLFDASVYTAAKSGVYFRVYSGYSVAADKLIAETVCKTQSWNQKLLGIAGTFETGASDAVTLCIYNANNLSWVDDITLTKVDTTVNETLVNGDFETGDKSGWITTSGATIYTPENGVYFINDSALCLSMGEAAIQYIKVKPNTAYSYHMLTRLANFTANEIIGLKVRVLSGAKELASEVFSTFNEHVNQTHNAAVVDGVFVSDDTGVIKLMLQNDHKQIIIVDDVAVTEVAEFANGDFANGLEGWNPASSGYVDSETSVYTNTIINSGDYAINGNTVQFGKEGAFTQIIKVKPNTVYGFTAKGRTGDNPFLSIKVFGGGNFDALLANSDLTTTTWADTPIALDGVFNSGDNEYVNITVTNGSTTNAAWIDDISILAQESESPISLYGTSVLYRLYNNAQGLRFAFEIADKGESFNMYGKSYEVVSSGTLVGIMDNFGEVAAESALSIGSELATNCANSRTYIQKSGKIVYTALITDINEDYAYTTFAARPYIVARDADGNTRIFYGAVVESDLGTAYESMSEADKALVSDDAIIF